MSKTLTVRLIPSARTDLPCLVCGGFRTHLAIVVTGGAPEDAHVGLHRECAPGRRKETAT